MLKKNQAAYRAVNTTKTMLVTLTRKASLFRSISRV